METKQGDILREQLGADAGPKPVSSTITRDKIKGTPFYIIGNEEQDQFMATMAKWKISPDFKTKEEVLAYIDENFYLVIVTMISITLAAMGTEDYKALATIDSEVLKEAEKVRMAELEKERTEDRMKFEKSE